MRAAGWRLLGNTSVLHTQHNTDLCGYSFTSHVYGLINPDLIIMQFIKNNADIITLFIGLFRGDWEVM